MIDKKKAGIVLWLTTTILESMDITYWIDSGTLLSAYRDKDINQYDHDVDIRTYVEQFPDEVLAEFVKRCWEVGFLLIDGFKPLKGQLLMRHMFQTLIDLKFCYHDNEHLWYYCWAEPDPKPAVHLYPIKFFNLGSIELPGPKCIYKRKQPDTIQLYPELTVPHQYPCPTPVEEYIEYHYGPEWRLFKRKPRDANETDLTWDHMKDPPCSMTWEEFKMLKGKVNARWTS